MNTAITLLHPRHFSSHYASPFAAFLLPCASQVSTLLKLLPFPAAFSIAALVELKKNVLACKKG